jgi:hypothetical protein
MQFADGMSYSKTRLDELFKSGYFDRAASRKKEVVPPQKKEDVEFIVGTRYCANFTGPTTQMREFDLPKLKAEKMLAQHKGDRTETIRFLIQN